MRKFLWPDVALLRVDGYNEHFEKANDTILWISAAVFTDSSKKLPLHGKQ